MAAGLLSLDRSVAGSVAAHAVPAPTGWFVTDWSRDPLSLGSYATIPPGSNSTIRTVAERPAGGRFVLAGEAYDRAKPGTVNGALSSGRRAATALLGAWRSGSGGTGSRSVVVVGAGVAGLAAGAALAQAGVKTTVFEARSRLGGRLHTDRSLGFPVELGASWVHGLKANPLVPILRAAGRSLRRTNYDDLAVYDLGGTPVSPDAVGAAQDLLWRDVSKAQDDGEEGDSLAQGLAAVGYPADPLHAWALTTEIEQDYAADASQLSLEHFDDDADLVGGDAMVVGGYDAVPNALARGLTVHRSTTVQAVRPAGRGIEAVLEGGTVRADAAVVTAPVSLLAAGAIDIDWSALGATAQRQAVGRFGMGDLEKAIVLFGRRFWAPQQILGVVGYREGTFAESYDLSAVVGRPALVAFSAGEQARSLPEASEQVVAMLMTVLTAVAVGAPG